MKNDKYIYTDEFLLSVWAVRLILQIYYVQELYTHDVDINELKKLFDNIELILKNSKDNELWNQIKDEYISPELDKTPPLFLLIAHNTYLKDSNKITKAIEERAIKNPSFFKEISDLYHRFNLIRLFDCKFPQSDLFPEYQDTKRFLFLLEKYWHEYLKILEFIGTAPMFFVPNPLAEVIINLEYRINYCIDKLDNPELRSGFNAVLDYNVSYPEEFNMAWDCGGIETAENFNKIIKQVRFVFGQNSFKLTAVEEFSFERLDLELKKLKEDTKKCWEKNIEALNKRFENNIGKPKQDNFSIFKHSPDFRSVNNKGKEYSFTPNQAIVVKALYEAYKNGTPELGQEYILDKILEYSTSDLKDYFKNNPAWKTLIIQGKTRGTYRLNI